MSDPMVRALLSSWELEPTVLLGVALAAGLYGLGLRRIWQHVGLGAVASPWRAAAFAAGLLAVISALLSPIATFSSLLFSAHMAQHLLLTMVAAPLLLLGAPLLPTLWALPLSARRMIGGGFRPGARMHALFSWLTRPIPALGLHTVTVWAWHVPAFYELALRSESMHYLQHALFFGTALLFWWPVIQPVPGQRGMPYGLRLLYLLGGAIVQTKLLGALLTFARTPLYPHYTQVPRIWGLSALDDQQLAGLLMFVGGAMMLFLALTIVFFVWVAREERDETRVQQPAMQVQPRDLLDKATGLSDERTDPSLGTLARPTDVRPSARRERT